MNTVIMASRRYPKAIAGSRQHHTHNLLEKFLPVFCPPYMAASLKTARSHPNQTGQWMPDKPPLKIVLEHLNKKSGSLTIKSKKSLKLSTPGLYPNNTHAYCCFFFLSSLKISSKRSGGVSGWRGIIFIFKGGVCGVACEPTSQFIWK
jgi:hypothetical protein